jgi:hypothetical protein
MGRGALVIALAEGRIPEIVLHVIERRLTVADAVALERLRKTASDDRPATLIAKSPRSPFGGGAAGDASPHGGNRQDANWHLESGPSWQVVEICQSGVGGTDRGLN